MIHDLNRLKTFREDIEDKTGKLYYDNKKKEHDIQENTHSIEEIEKEVQEVQKTLKFKVDGEVMNEEMQSAQQRVNE